MSNVEIITKTKLPIQKTKNAHILTFKYNNEMTEYFCIIIGDVDNVNNFKNFTPTVRIHSQWLQEISFKVLNATVVNN